MTLQKAASSAVLNIALERIGKKRRSRKKKLLQHGYLYLGTYPSANPAEQGLTLLSGGDMVLSLWYSDSTLNAFFVISKIKGNKERQKNSLILAGTMKNEKMRGMKMRIITCFGDRTRSGTFFIIVSVSRTRITRSLGPITS